MLKDFGIGGLGLARLRIRTAFWRFLQRIKYFDTARALIVDPTLRIPDIPKPHKSEKKALEIPKGTNKSSLLTSHFEGSQIQSLLLPQCTET